MGFSTKTVAKVNIARTMASAVDTDLVLAEDKGSNGLLIINRPKALNAGNYEMVEKVGRVLSEWRTTKKLIVVKGAGDKAFCAGGDVRTLVEAPTPLVGQTFFRTEYAMNYTIGTLTIPYIALIDGITMGGGVGLSVHGKYRVATERTLFAMPETAIGLFPDVGGSYFLPRLQGQLGLYLGLTGYRLKGKDVLSAGIATHYCDSAKIEELEQALLSTSSADKVESVLSTFCVKQSDSKFALADHLEQINRCFDAPSVEKILENLKNDGSDWATKTIEVKMHSGFVVCLYENVSLTDTAFGIAEEPQGDASRGHHRREALTGRVSENGVPLGLSLHGGQ